MEGTTTPSTMPVETKLHLLRTNEIIYAGTAVLAAGTTALSLLRHDIPAAEVGALILAPTAFIAGFVHHARNYLRRKISEVQVQS
ncbi:MAG TPA: hypothetical protein VL944_00190 [Candidatus Acidoferrum sp.]|nr:hypothetical protein [Candidatus Acidoferrum sp.]